MPSNGGTANGFLVFRYQHQFRLDRFFNPGAVALSLLIASAGLAGQSAVAQPQIYLPPFYSATDALDPSRKPLGAVLASEPVDSTVPGNKAWRIAYISSDTNGKRNVTTGLIVVPDGPVPLAGRPIVAWAHGTTGTARRCGPSQMPQPAQPLNQYLLPSGTSYSDFGLPAMQALLKRGYVIVATDYQGLGGPGVHHYAVASTNGRDVIDSVRAAHNFKPAQAGTQAVIYGWSQGGGAVLAAAGEGDYMKATAGGAAVTLLGTVAMAPEDLGIVLPANIATEPEAQKVVSTFNRDLIKGNLDHLAMLYWGQMAAQDNIRLTDVFSDSAVTVVSSLMQNKCIHELSASLDYTYGQSAASVLRPMPRNALAILRGMKQFSPSLNPLAPVAIYYGNNDVTVPHIMHKLYWEQACKNGAKVSRQQLPGNNTHFSTPGAAESLYVPWITDRFAGKPVPNGCPTSS